MHDEFQNKCKIFQPSNPPLGGSPLVLLFHGGGFAVGSPNQYTALGRALAEFLGAVCIAASYRLVPEHPFPMSAIDAWDTVRFVATNAEAMYRANLNSGFVVGGASAGSNLAAVANQLAKDHGLARPLTGLYLSVPFTMWADNVPVEYRDRYISLKQNADAPIHPTSALLAMVERYNPVISSPYFSPLNSTSGQSGLPPAYIQVCGSDSIRDDGLIFNDILKYHGVTTKLDLYPGLPHGSWLFLPMLKSSLKIMVDMVKGIGWLLGREVSSEVVTDHFSGKFGYLIQHD